MSIGCRRFSLRSFFGQYGNAVSERVLSAQQRTAMSSGSTDMPRSSLCRRTECRRHNHGTAVQQAGTTEVAN